MRVCVGGGGGRGQRGSRQAGRQHRGHLSAIQESFKVPDSCTYRAD